MWNKSISILSTTSCQLECFFCAYGNGIKVKHEIWKIDQFKTLIDMLIENKFNNVDLTPVIGDIFQDPDIYEKLRYMNEKDLDFEAVSNILSLKDEMVSEILKSERFEFSVSIYGWDHESYLRNTKKPKFDVFFKKLKLFQTCEGPFDNLRLSLRCEKLSDMPDSELKNVLLDLASKGAIIDEDELVHKNWGGHLDFGPKRIKKGMCNRFLFENGIFPNGDITLCGCWDLDREFVIGNIYKQSLEEIYDLSKNEKLHQLIKDQIKSIYKGPCSKCNDFEQVKSMWGYDWIKKYGIVLNKQFQEKNV